MSIVIKPPHDMHQRDILVLVVVIFVSVAAVIGFEAYRMTVVEASEESISPPEVIISSPDTKIFDILKTKRDVSSQLP